MSPWNASLGRWVLVAVLALCAAGCEMKPPPKPKPPRPAAQQPAVPAPVPVTEPGQPAVEPPPQPPPPAPALPLVRVQGTSFVDPEGKPVRLRGCNIGNWLLLEMWMLDIQGVKDQHEFEGILAKRFGRDGKERLMEIYRSHYITERDFPIIASFGFNTVRLPFEYRLLEDERSEREIRADAFRWLDRAIGWAEARGLYVILDLHGAPGRQSVDHTTGRAGQNHLWDDPANQERTIRIWRAIAEKYRDSTTVAGYDLINEPFGDMQTPKHHAKLAELVDRLHDAIRAIDTNHVIFIPGTLRGIEFYGDPREREWRNVAFTEHYYPGLFGSQPTLDEHARFIHRRVPARAAYLKRFDVPLLVGEFNVVFDRLNGSALMRRYYDVYAAQGWAATMWSYKLLRKGGGPATDFWGMVCNRDPLTPIDIKTSTFEEIAAWFTSFGTMPYSVHTNL
jgi:endoglucanase